MPVNFERLPNSNPSGGGLVVPNGPYYAVIARPEMRTPKEKNADGTDKLPYLNYQLQLKDAQRKSMGNIFDLQSESTHEVARYKLRRFIEALEIPITGEFELKDLVKIIANKELIVDVKVEERNGKTQSVVDIFSGDIYYSVREAARIFGNSAGVAASESKTEDEPPFNISEETGSEY